MDTTQTSVLRSLAAGASHAGIHMSYGDVVTVDGTEMLPVALVAGGFGAGEGSTSSDQSGEGGGGGGCVIPVGAYIKYGGRLVFRPNFVVGATVAVPLVFVVGRALKSLVKALKR